MRVPRAEKLKHFRCVAQMLVRNGSASAAAVVALFPRSVEAEMNGNHAYKSCLYVILAPLGVTVWRASGRIAVPDPSTFLSLISKFDDVAVNEGKCPHFIEDIYLHRLQLRPVDGCA